MKNSYKALFTCCSFGMVLALGCGTGSKNNSGEVTTPAPQTIVQAPATQTAVPDVTTQTPAVDPSVATAPATAPATPTVPVAQTIPAATTEAPAYIVTITDSNGNVIDQKAINLNINQVNDPAVLGTILAGGQSMVVYGSGGMQGCFGRWCRMAARNDYRHMRPDMRREGGRDYRGNAANDQDLTLQNGQGRVGYAPSSQQPVVLKDGRRVHIYKRR